MPSSTFMKNLFSWRNLIAFAYFGTVLFYVKPLWNVFSAALIVFGAVWCLREFRKSRPAGFSFPRGETFAFWSFVFGAWLLFFLAFGIQRAMGVSGVFDEFRVARIFLTAFAAAWVAFRISLRGIGAGAAVCGYALPVLCVLEMIENDFKRVSLGTNPNWIALYGFVLAFSLFLFSESAFNRKKIGFAFLLFFSGIGVALMIVLSGSRSGLLALVVGLGVVCFFDEGCGFRVRAAIVIALSLFAAWILPNGALNRAESVIEQNCSAGAVDVAREMTNGRFEIWQECLRRYGNNNFWVGSGGESLDFYLGEARYHVHVGGGSVHNTFLARWCEYGVIGLAGTLLMFFSNAAAGIVGMFKSVKMRSRELRIAAAWNIALSCALFSAGMFEDVPCGRYETILVATTQAFFLYLLLKSLRERVPVVAPRLASVRPLRGRKHTRYFCLRQKSARYS